MTPAQMREIVDLAFDGPVYLAHFDASVLVDVDVIELAANDVELPADAFKMVSTAGRTVYIVGGRWCE